MKRLDTFDIKGSTLTDTSLENLSQNNQFVEYLNLSKCTFIQGEGLVSFLTSEKSQKLKYLDISCSTVQDFGVESIKNVENSLEKLKIFECGNISEEGFEKLFSFNNKDQDSNKKHFQNLKELDLSWSQIGEKGLNNFFKIYDGKLQELNIPRCKLLNGSALKNYFGNFENLEQMILIDLSFNDWVDEDFLNIIIKKFLSQQKEEEIKLEVIYGYDLPNFTSKCKKELKEYAISKNVQFIF